MVRYVMYDSGRGKSYIRSTKYEFRNKFKLQMTKIHNKRQTVNRQLLKGVLDI